MIDCRGRHLPPVTNPYQLTMFFNVGSGLDFGMSLVGAYSNVNGCSGYPLDGRQFFDYNDLSEAWFREWQGVWGAPDRTREQWLESQDRNSILPPP